MMWPWEHLAIGYLVYSGWSRLVAGRAPSDPAAIVALVIGSQLPDLVDKPLAWGLGVLPAGASLAHSVFFAVPATVLVGVVARRASRPAVGVAFGLAYLLHLPADALYGAVVYGGPVQAGAFAWPVVPAVPSERPGLVANVSYYLDRYAAVMASPSGRAYLAAEVLLVGATVVQWFRDGTPGLELVTGS